jgi:hypothetical protein
MLRDRRGVGIAEYALMLFLVVALAAVVFRYMGKSVKHAGNKTEEQFQTSNAGGANSAGGASSAGGGTAGGGGPAAAGGGGGKSGGGGGGGGGGASGGSGGGGGNSSSTSGGPNGVGEEEEAQSTPLWKIIGGVFVVLFAIGGYFAFRKQSKGG